VIEKSRELGFLVGRDILRLHTAAESRDEIEIENPVASLAIPPDPEKLEWNFSQYRFSINQLVLMRVSDERTHHFLVSQNLELLSETLREEVEKLLKSLRGDVEEIEVEMIDDVLQRARDISERALRTLKKRHELLIVESFSNVAAPNKESTEADLIIGVFPGKAIVYEGEKYRKAMEILLDFREPWQINLENLMELLKPLKTIELKPKELGNRGIFEELRNEFLNL
ncbi:MAG: hypothetical protein PWR13_313, partial [Archaeoglobi archaeon]|nr:hypothetical protein [Archaeoglobi archaeon]